MELILQQEWFDARLIHESRPGNKLERFLNVKFFDGMVNRNILL
jgi:hypothetical protein